MRLILLGPPGTGKGTQAQRLSDRHGWPMLSSGHVLRTEIQANSEIGRKAAQYVSAGALVPDEVITGVMLAAVAKIKAGSGFILDGFPRTVPQAEALDEGLRAQTRPIQGVLDFQMGDDLIVKRIAGRRVCNRCGNTYNVEFLPPKAKDVCDRCGETLVQRVDDREDVVLTRLKTYRAQTAPLVEFYTRKGLLRRVDSSAAAPAVEAEVARILASLGEAG